jgi:hypothetical protein
MQDTTPVPTPKHLWVVGVLALLWNGIGAFDYLMYELRSPAYLSQFTPEQLAYFEAFPSWAIATWATSVWGGVLGSALLLARRRLAVAVFGVSLAAYLPTALYQLVLTDGMAMMGGIGLAVFCAVIFTIAVALLVYARAQAGRGVLR